VTSRPFYFHRWFLVSLAALRYALGAAFLLILLNNKTMLFTVIAIFIALIFVGAIADGLLSKKTKENKTIRFLLFALPSPYNIMRLYSKVGDNLDDFTRAHAVSGMAYLGIMLIVSSFAWWADQQVLFGIEYTATLDYSYSMWQSVGIATIIQAVLIFNGGMAVKLWINGVITDKEHRFQFRIHTLLAICAFATTGYLSLQTDKLARAKGIQAKDLQAETIKANTDSEASKYEKEISLLKAEYRKDSIRIMQDYTDAIQAATDVFLADSTRKAKDAELRISHQDYAQRRINGFRTVLAQKLQAAKTEKQKRFEELDNRIGSQISKLQSVKTDMLAGLQTSIAKMEGDIYGEIDFNAQTTRYKNLLLNIIALFFNLGLQLFVRGANANERSKKATMPNYNAPIEANEALEQLQPETPIKPTPKPENPEGGTLEANSNLEKRVEADGQVLMLYKGTEKEEWWGWSNWRAALVNRVNKYNKAKGEKSKATQLAWIRLIEDKMKAIEQGDKSGKTFASRKVFDPKNPENPLF